MGNDMPSEVPAIFDLFTSLLGHIDLLPFDRGFYSKDLINSLNKWETNYLIFVLRNPQAREEFSSMHQTQRKVILHESPTYKNGSRISDSFHLAFMIQIFGHRTEEYYYWWFASNTSDIDLDHIIAKYKFR